MAEKPKRSRFTVSSLQLIGGLVACYLLLTRAVPALEQAAPGQGEVERQGMARTVSAASRWTRTHANFCMAAGVALAVLGVVLPLLVRPTRYLVMLVALAVIALDVWILVAAYAGLLTTTLREAGGLAR
jgi:hypothetical protein